MGTISSIWTPPNGNVNEHPLQQVLVEVSGCPASSDCTPGCPPGSPSSCAPMPWKDFTLEVLRRMNARGYCMTYDADHGNGGMASEGSMRQDESVNENLQVQNSAGKVRWLPGALRTRCTPAFDTYTVAQLEQRWGITPPPPVHDAVCRIPAPTGQSEWWEPRVSQYAAGRWTVTPYACKYDPNPGASGVYPEAPCKNSSGGWAACCKAGAEVAWPDTGAGVGRACEAQWVMNAPPVFQVEPGSGDLAITSQQGWNFTVTGSGILRVNGDGPRGSAYPGQKVCWRWRLPEQQNLGDCRQAARAVRR